MEASQASDAKSSDIWLVRTAKNRILGPFSRKEIAEKVRTGAFELQDEICPGNGYWIYLHEREEVFQQLGVEVPRNAVDHDEITETQTDLKNRFRADVTKKIANVDEHNASQASAASAAAAAGAAGASVGAGAGSGTGASDSIGANTENSDASGRERTSEIVIQPLLDGAPVRKPVEIEKGVIYRAVVWVMVSGIFIVLTLVFRLIRAKS